MSKVVTADFRPSKLNLLKKALCDEELSFVLITCSPPEEGKINVEMDCNGDPDLLALAIKNAESYFN